MNRHRDVPVTQGNPALALTGKAGVAHVEHVIPRPSNGRHDPCHDFDAKRYFDVASLLDVALPSYVDGPKRSFGLYWFMSSVNLHRDTSTMNFSGLSGRKLFPSNDLLC